MKKIVSFLILFVMLIAMSTVVTATSSDGLADELYELGKAYGMSESDKIRIERYLADNKVTDEQASQIFSKAKEAAEVMDNAGKTNYSKLSESQKNEIKAIVVDAAKILDLTLEFSNKQLKIYQDGKLIDVITYDSNGKLAYTGNNLNIILAISTVAMIALALVIVARKKNVNA